MEEEVNKKGKKVIKITKIILIIFVLSFLIFLTIKNQLLPRYEKVILIDDKEYIKYTGEFELPLNGSTGYSPITQKLRKNPNPNAQEVSTLNPGDPFIIIEEYKSWLKVKYGDEYGYLESQHCLINLSDVLPSIVYNITNSFSSEFRTSGKSIPHITGEKLYDTYFFNERLNKYEYSAPIRYSTAKKIAKIQKEALKNDETLIIYETFRPYTVQNNVAKYTLQLARQDSNIYNGLNKGSFSTDWFISTGISNHQKGYAIDVSLGKVTKIEEQFAGDYVYTFVANFEEYEMSSKIHELSIQSTKYNNTIGNRSSAWKTMEFANHMTDGSKKLHNYFIKQGFYPLTSEWWHFNDFNASTNNNGNGKYTINSIVSKQPNTQI